MLFHRKSHSVHSVFPLLLLLCFCLFTMILSGTGALVYKHSAAQLEENYTSRTAISYISEKLRQHNRYDQITLCELKHLPALRLQEQIDHEQYYAYIYFYDQSLRELFVHEDTDASPEMGSMLISLSALEFRSIPDKALLSVTAVSPEGNELHVFLHCPSVELADMQYTS